MSSDRTCEEAWGYQLAYHARAGTKPPERMDPETEAILREIMGDEVVDQIKAKEPPP